MKFVVDACSVILLAKSTVLEELAKWRGVKITKEVYNGVLEGKDKKLLDALLLEKLVQEKKVFVENNLKEKIIQKLAFDFGLGAGEAESITLALETPGKIIITDNKQGRKAAKVYGLNLAGSIDTVISLYKAKRISREKAVSSIKTLKKEGWFQDYLIEQALSEVKDG